MSTVGASSASIAPATPALQADIYTIQEVVNLYSTEQTYDLAVIQKLHRSFQHHGIKNLNIRRIGRSLDVFFDPAKNGDTFPPSKDPALSKTRITLSRGPKYLFAMLGQCAPLAAEHQGFSACKQCQNARNPRYASCRTVVDGQGNALAKGACMACTSVNHPGECSFVTGVDTGDGEQAEDTFELEAYHHLSIINKFDLMVQVTSTLQMVDVQTKELSEMPVDAELRIGVRLPGTDSYQLESEDFFDFEYKAEGKDLRRSVRAAAASEAIAASPAGTYVSPNDFHTLGLLRASKTIICRTNAGERIEIAAGDQLLYGEPKHFPGTAMLLTMEGEQRDYFPLPESLFNQHLAQGTFEYANKQTERQYYGTIDFTDEELLHTFDFTSPEDAIACGVECQGVRIGKREPLQYSVVGGAVSLCWGRNAAEEAFVHGKPN